MGNNKNLRQIRVKRVALIVLGAALIFTIGLGVGRGDISFQSRQGINGQLPANLDYSSVEQVYDSLKENYGGKLTTDQLLNGLKEGLAGATNDPYTEFFTAEEAEQFQNNLNNTFSGIGAELGKDASDNLIVVAPIKGYPADKAGLRARDVITAVDGKSTQGWSISKAVSVIRGEKGTKVSLRIIRGDKQLTFDIVRQDIQLPSVTSEITKDNIGYLQISTFGQDTADLVSQAATKFQKAKVRGVVLDLRGNPGGLLSAAVAVSSQWLPEGALILQEKRGGTVIEEFRSQGEHRLVGIPTVVLINGGSASASEITAGALHDNDAARLMGEKSFGKGSVQQIVRFGDGSELKVTVASWYRPNGQNIDEKGIAPDQKISLTEKDIEAGKDTQKAAALNYLKNN